MYTMKLMDLKLTDYLEILKSDAPAPGGGSVSALAGAQGIALLIMVNELTLGREKYSGFQEANAVAKEKAQVLLKAFIQLVDEDTDAYNMVADAYKMPKETEDEKKKRADAIQEGTIKSTEVPLSVMKAALEGLEIISGLKGKTNPSAMSDLGVAALNLLTCLRGAWLNVKINLPGIKDVDKAKAYEETGQKIHERAESLSDLILKTCM